MPFMDMLIVALAVALLLSVARLQGHPRINALTAWCYSVPLLVGLGVPISVRTLVYAMATGFVGLALARLGRGEGGNESGPTGVSGLRSHIPRL